MSWHRRSYPHQNLKARQGGSNGSNSSGLQPTTTDQISTPAPVNTPSAIPNNVKGGGNSNDNGNSKGGDKNGPTTSSPSPTPAAQTQSPNAVTSSPAQNASPTTAPGPSSPSTTIALATSANTNVQTVATSSINTTPTLTHMVSTHSVVGPSTAIFTYTSLTGSTTSSATTGTSSSNNSKTVGGTPIGVIVGAIAGGLFGLICLMVLVSYIVRWWSKNKADRDFVDDYNPPVTTDDNSAPDFQPPMTQHHSSPSLSSSVGIAGQGVLASRANTMAGRGTHRGGYGSYPSVDDESINGIYSSQPQLQAPYNPESYGQYAYPDAAYQEAMRDYQGQRGYEAPVNNSYMVSGPSTPQRPIPASLTAMSASPKTTAAAAIAAAHAAAAVPAPAAPASPEPRQSIASYYEEDAYSAI